MHYIRLLRAPKVAAAGGRCQATILFTITTDLGDSFLYPTEYIDIQITAKSVSASGITSWPLSDKGKIQWQPGMRVAKPVIDIPRDVLKAIKSGDQVQLEIRPLDSARAEYGLQSILAVPSKKRSRIQQQNKPTEEGLIMPAWVSLVLDHSEIEVATRRLQLGVDSDEHSCLEIEEEIGESIARHIWDAGVVALCAIAELSAAPDHTSSTHTCMRHMRALLEKGKALSILEIGCGVGVLGVGLGAICLKSRQAGSGDCTILMTDLPEAEERACANIARLEEKKSAREADGGDDEKSASSVKLLYENLDWEDGRLGNFGTEVTARSWDLVVLSDCTYNVDMLPALVETLSALHESNVKHEPRDKHTPEGQPVTTQVFLATKPRHESEKALFGLMDGHGWKTLHKQVLPLPVIGSEDESVEMYLFAKS